MLTVVLGVILLYAILKWMMCRLSIAALLLYYVECGLEMPSHDTIQEYRTKVVEKYINSRKSKM